jgi:hypothetical protein
MKYKIEEIVGFSDHSPIDYRKKSLYPQDSPDDPCSSRWPRHAELEHFVPPARRPQGRSKRLPPPEFLQPHLCFIRLRKASGQ